MDEEVGKDEEIFFDSQTDLGQMQSFIMHSLSPVQKKSIDLVTKAVASSLFAWFTVNEALAELSLFRDQMRKKP